MKPLPRRVSAAVAALALAVLYLGLLVFPRLRSADQMAYVGRFDGGTALLTVDRLALASISVLTLAAATLAIALSALRRYGMAFAVRVSGSILLAACSAEILNRFLPQSLPGLASHPHLQGGSFPSGHATIATAVSLGAATVIGPRAAQWMWGPLVAWVVIVSAATLSVGWHRPSDAIAGTLLGAAWHTGLVRGRGVNPPAEASEPRHRDVDLPHQTVGFRWWFGTSLVVVVAATTSSAMSELVQAEASVLLYVGGLATILAVTAIPVHLGSNRLRDQRREATTIRRYSGVVPTNAPRRFGIATSR